MIPGNFPDLAREQSYSTPLQNSTLLPFLLLSLASQKHTPNTKSYFEEQYDYIVVGGGTAGSVVASRLSEIHSVTVLVLEAGPSPPLITEVPVISRSFRNSDLDWQYFTEPQKYTSRLQINKQMPWPSGKAIGGSSIVNSNLYVRASYENYDDWEAQGATGWNSKEAFLYFIKAEDNKVPEFVDNGYHGVGGPMTVEMFGKRTELRDPLIRSHKNLGYPYVDINGPSQLGAANYQGNLRKGQRCSTAKAYLVPAEHRKNLDIIENAFVTKILIENKKAIGVRFDYKGLSYTVKAKREVILSAGTVNSAQLLMLSGIGPKMTLQRFGIPLVADLPVGLNFHNHGGPVAFFRASKEIPTFSEKLQNEANVREYIDKRSGVLAASEAIFAFTFCKVDPHDKQSAAPDYQIYFFEADSQTARRRLNVPNEVYNQIYGPYENGTNFYCNVQVMKPRSRGRVSIRSSKPYDHPTIDPNYFEDPQDVKIAVAGLKECFRILDTPEMKRVGVSPFDTVIPGCEKFSDVDSYLECSAKSIFVGASHPVGTAKMGNPADPTTVVDPKLRVKGIKGLRVVDASIMPIVPTGNTYAIVVMVAEKASDMIKKDIWVSDWNPHGK